VKLGTKGGPVRVYTTIMAKRLETLYESICKRGNFYRWCMIAEYVRVYVVVCTTDYFLTTGYFFRYLGRRFLKSSLLHIVATPLSKICRSKILMSNSFCLYKAWRINTQSHYPRPGSYPTKSALLYPAVRYTNFSVIPGIEKNKYTV
jgi:hypothetical protein